MSDFPINHKNLIIARENAGYSTQEATQKIFGKKNSEPDRVQEWENKEKTPTWKQLKKLADKYQVNIFVLTNDKLITKNRNIQDFRKKYQGNDVSLNTKKYLNFLLQRQRYLSDVLRNEKAQKNTLVGCGQNINEPSKLAKLMREQLAYKYNKQLAYQYNKDKHGNHLKYLIELLENKRVFVMKSLSYWAIEVSNMRGVYLKDDFAPIIALNRKDSKTAQLFTLAHEIAHLCINSEAISNIEFRDDISNEKEQFCNKVAADFLLPLDKFEPRNYELEDIKEFASLYGFSELFVFYRLKNLKKIASNNILRDETMLSKKMKNNLDYGSNSSRGGNSNNNMRDSNGTLFNRFIASMYFENKINAFEASKILRMSIEQV